MSIKRTVVGLAAAVTLVVAGTALGQSANTNTPVTDKDASSGVKYGLFAKAGAATNKFTVTYTAAAPAAPTITTTATATGSIVKPVLSYNVATAIASTNAGDKDPANLGTVKIVCKHDRYDVLLWTKNGGTLVKPASGTGGSAVAAATLQKATPAAPATRSNATLALQLSIKKGAATTSTETDYGYYTMPTIPATAITEATGIAFSQAFFGTDNTLDVPLTGFETALGGSTVKLCDADPASVKSAGFVKPTTTDNSITFGVSAGLGIDGTTNILSGNGAGAYTEEITFLVYAGSY